MPETDYDTPNARQHLHSAVYFAQRLKGRPFHSQIPAGHDTGTAAIQMRGQHERSVLRRIFVERTLNFIHPVSPGAAVLSAEYLRQVHFIRLTFFLS